MAVGDRVRGVWQAALKADDDLDTDNVRIGEPPETRRHQFLKLMWIGIWFSYLAAPFEDILGDHHTVLADVLGGLGLVLFVGVYLALVFRHTSRALERQRVFAVLGALLAMALMLSLTLGAAWLVLFVYVCVAIGAVLPMRLARILIPVVSGILLFIGVHTPGAADFLWALMIPSMLGGFAMVGVRQMARTTRALREARATVAHLAANEERLRLARDLHDLLGHSLSLITLKSELAGRMLPGSPEAAAQQIADIEQVSRQALVDVREAVSGFRRPTLDAEIAGARTALAAAGVTADLDRVAVRDPGPDGADESPLADLTPDAEGALAWALREAVTNVVRHSGARRCEVSLAEEGGELRLTVTDDGHGPARPHGNGLTGLTERLALADGRLETGPGPRGGFRLRACVPLVCRRAPQDGPAAPLGAS
ncbi:histidine kinase [Streptomyces eurocidicus]|uniref:Histidine kinase n=1 Tax=Streptomyces eurocidicus TaxID=66423 RepID=A0A2N8NRI5_STREU|nr:sensor histidine kinase [Streptomyces eurocidicus]MBB5117194.1 two-component system sensor histidine kinase DesK [Streptomyces eurocidicus]MBF6052514.1 sensor histidine kinase [Streptomyces eurocidicus]PNE31376.1 histidine kinase [Streptomyces eurocidicus]